MDYKTTEILPNSKALGFYVDDYHKGAGMFERMGVSVYPRVENEVEEEERGREKIEGGVGGPSGTHVVKK